VRRLFQLIVLFKEYVVLGALVLASFLLMAISQTNEVQPLRAMATIIVGSLQSTGSWIPNPFAISRENDELRDRNILLTTELANLRKAKGENAELRKLLGLKNNPGWKVIAADVVGKTTIGERNMLTLNVGNGDNVEKGMPVITDGGLIGRIFTTSLGFSMAEGLFNRNLRIAVKVARTRTDGILSWEGGDELLVRNIPKALDVQIGDEVVTSEYSTLFPSDISVGTVIRIEPEANSFFRKVFLQPTAHPMQVEHCFVVLKDGQTEKERAALQTRVTDSLNKPVKKPVK
jgi:rod shape-determining protein MreC